MQSPHAQDMAAPGVTHFKKCWLQRNNSSNSEAGSAGARKGSFTSPGGEKHLIHQMLRGSAEEACYFQGNEAKLSREAAVPSPITLNIPRFMKYGTQLPMVAPCVTDSSAVTESKADAGTRSWARHSTMPSSHHQITPESSPMGGVKVARKRQQVDEAWIRQHSSRLQLRMPSEGFDGSPLSGRSPRAERMAIDINKPPPSPEHSQSCSPPPLTPCSAMTPELTAAAASPKYHSAVMEYSLPGSPMDWPERRGALKGLPLLHLPDLTRSPASAKGGDESPQRPRAARGDAPTNVAVRKTPSLMQRRPRSQWNGSQVLSMTSLGSQCADQKDDEPEDSHADEDPDEDEDATGSTDDEGRAPSEGAEEEQAHKAGVAKSCLHCGTTKTPLWRNGPPGPKSLCNACGIRFNKIRSGKRKPTPKEASMLLKYERSGSYGGSSTTANSCGSSDEQEQRRKEESQHQRKDQHRPPQLPLATAHKSRSKLGAVRSSGPRVSPLKTKRSDVEEEQSQGEAAPKEVLEALGDSRAKRPRMIPGSSAPEFLRGALQRQDSAELAGSCAAMERDDDGSSSEHESCLSGPGLSPPSSPKHGLHAGANFCLRESAAGKASEGEREQSRQSISPDLVEEEEESDDDVEVGARMLMEILNSLPAPGVCC